MSERQPGWYWVNEHSYEDWRAWYWNGVDFSGVDEDCFAVIGDRIPTPDEPWQCVPKVLGAQQYLAIRQFYGVDIAIAFEEAWEDALESAPKPGEEQ